MDAPPSRRGGRAGAVFVALVLAGSAAGVIGWHLSVNRRPPPLDISGLDLDSAPASPRTVALPAAPASPAPESGLSMIKGGTGLRVAEPGAYVSRPVAAPGAASGGAAAAGDFREVARRYEPVVQAFAERMTAKYPVIRQYGKDWMSYPDLRRLNDDYFRDHDPIRFMIGLSQSRNFGKLAAKYAGAPEIREFIVEGVRQAPPELTASAMSALQQQAVVRNFVSNIIGGLGLPPGIGAMLGGGAAGLDQGKIMAGMLNDPRARRALEQNAPAVPLGQ